MTSVLVRKGREKDSGPTESQARRSCENRGETGVLLTQSWSARSSGVARRGKEGISLWAFSGSLAGPALWFQSSSLHNSEEKDFCFKSPVLWWLVLVALRKLTYASRIWLNTDYYYISLKQWLSICRTNMNLVLDTFLLKNAYYYMDCVRSTLYALTWMCHLWIPFPRLQAFLNSWELVMDWTFVTPEDSYVETLTPDVICIWKWGLWEVIRCTWGHEGRGPHDVIIVLTKRGTETRQAHSLSYGALTRVRSQETESSTLQAPQPCKIDICCYSHHIYVTLLQQPELTSTRLNYMGRLLHNEALGTHITS